MNRTEKVYLELARRVEVGEMTFRPLTIDEAISTGHAPSISGVLIRTRRQVLGYHIRRFRNAARAYRKHTEMEYTTDSAKEYEQILWAYRVEAKMALAEIREMLYGK